MYTIYFKWRVWRILKVSESIGGGHVRSATLNLQELAHIRNQCSKTCRYAKYLYLSMYLLKINGKQPFYIIEYVHILIT